MTIAYYFLLIFDRVMALDWYQNFVSVQYLGNVLIEFDQILYKHLYWQDADLGRYSLVLFTEFPTEL